MVMIKQIWNFFIKLGTDPEEINGTVALMEQKIIDRFLESLEKQPENYTFIGDWSEMDPTTMYGKNGMLRIVVDLKEETLTGKQLPGAPRIIQLKDVHMNRVRDLVEPIWERDIIIRLGASFNGLN